MAVQVTTKTSYGQRLGNSFKGIGSGFLLLIIGTVLLWWNEGRAVKTAKMLNRAEKVAVEMPDVRTVDPQFDGKLVHASGMTATNDVLIDNIFGIKENAVKLERKVEYYQVRETSTSTTKDKIGGGQETVTTYDYKEGWSSTRINSSEFKDEAYRGVNFVLCDAGSDRWTAENVTFGAYRLPKELISSISGDRPVDLNISEDILKRLNRAAVTAKRDTSKAVQAVAGELKYIHINENVLYIGADNMNPQVGDVRITFTKVLPAEVSVLAKVSGDTFQRHTDKNGKNLETLSMGVKSMDEMFSSERSSNKMWTWILRILGFFLIAGGLKGIFEILVTILKVIPFIANIVNLAMNVVLNVVAFAWTFIVIALAWVYYRPVLGILLLAIGVGALVFFAGKGKDQGPQVPRTPDTTTPSAE
ncbi:MAG: TMEM43 family protein [Bacteroidales bacterium]|nr:TMEM43 family protein [Bacteroidales bacterium]